MSYRPTADFVGQEWVFFDRLANVHLGERIQRGTAKFEEFAGCSIAWMSSIHGSDMYQVVYATDERERQLLFLLNTVAYLMNDAGKTLQIIG